MRRRERTEILVGCGPELTHRLAAAIEETEEVVEIIPPRQGLVMCKVRETARSTLFYLGEASMVECLVTVRGHKGHGMALGENLSLARDLAVIDAVSENFGDFASAVELDEEIRMAGRRLAVKRAREERDVLSSRVSFDTMGGQDMSVQAVVE